MRYQIKPAYNCGDVSGSGGARECPLPFFLLIRMPLNTLTHGPNTMSKTLHSFYTPHDRVTFSSGDQLITKQSMAAECDINNILKQFSKTGIINHINSNAAQYIDLPDNLDFQQSLAIIKEADDAFASLPSKVREQYKNDPARFLAALTDPAERDRLIEYGVIKRPPAGAAPPLAGAGDTPPPAAEKN